MGFTVVGPRRYLGSGHPDARDDLPSRLGLIESVDAGKTWTSVSLLGEADFHVLRVAGDLVYGYDAANDRLLVGADRGRRTPAALFARSGDELYAALHDGSIRQSSDGGATWRTRAIP